MRNNAAFRTLGDDESVGARGPGVSIPLGYDPRKGRSTSSDTYDTTYNSRNGGYPNRTFLSDQNEVRRPEARRYRNYSDGIPDKRVLGNDHVDTRMSRDELGHARAKIREDGYRRTAHLDIQGRGNEGGRGLNSNYSYEGPLNNYPGSGYGRRDEKVLNNRNESLDEFNRVDYLKLNRAELLRKLEELNNRLDGSCNVVEKPKPDMRIGHQEPYVAGGAKFSDASTSTVTSIQYFSHEKLSTPPPYNRRHPEPDPVVNRGEMGLHSLYDRPGYADTGQYQQQPSPPHLRYIDDDLAPFEPYPSHRLSCTCTYCYDNHGRAPPPMPATPHKSPTSYNHKNRSAIDPQVYDPKSSTLSQTSSPGRHSHARGWSGDVNSDMDSGVKSLPHRAVPAKNARRCRPVGGGAPFIACCNCPELLQLPKRMSLVDNKEQKIKCGACFLVLSCAVVDKELVVSLWIEAEPAPTAPVSNNADQVGKHSRNNTIDSDNILSDDFDSSCSDIQSMGTPRLQSLPDHDINTSKTPEKREIHSISAPGSKEEGSQDVLITGRELVLVNSTDQPNKPTGYPLPPGSSLQDYFDHSSNHRRHYGNLPPEKHMKSASVATEIDVSNNGYPYTGGSSDSGDIRKEDIRPKFNPSEHFVQENIESGQTKEDGKSNMLNGRPLPPFLVKRNEIKVQPVQTAEDGIRNVKINGRRLPDHLVKKAERLAGPIKTGEYWHVFARIINLVSTNLFIPLKNGSRYDYRAGFWGVIGGPCLGITSPYIEEFNYEMREDCAGGNTSVLVNGRELHSRDLKMLMSRGLPPDKDKSYAIDITGKVIDEDTGDELRSLGKLAPTVEKAKHGFGMKTPRSSAR